MSRFGSLLLAVLVLLAVVETARANLSLVDGKLELDATVRTGGHWWRAEQAGLTWSESGFERVGLFLGLTGRLSSVASLRASSDVGSLQARDLYIDLHWRGGLGLRAGQFLLPLGMDAMTEPDSQVLAGGSFLATYAKPAGVRDIGLAGRWGSDRFSASLAVVNGRGPNALEDNPRKDVCGRLAVRPMATGDADLALRVYHGWPGAPDTAWMSAALEARLNSGPFTVQTEIQNHRSQYARNNMAYLQAVWDAGLLEPAGRFDIILPQGKRIEWMMVGGVNLRPRSDHVKVMFDCSYHRDHQGNWSVFGFGLRLQAVL